MKRGKCIRKRPNRSVVLSRVFFGFTPTAHSRSHKEAASGLWNATFLCMSMANLRTGRLIALLRACVFTLFSSGPLSFVYKPRHLTNSSRIVIYSSDSHHSLLWSDLVLLFINPDLAKLKSDLLWYIQVIAITLSNWDRLAKPGPPLEDRDG